MDKADLSDREQLSSSRRELLQHSSSQLTPK